MNRCFKNRRLAGPTVLFVLLCVAPLAAQEPADRTFVSSTARPVLLEVFVSQGCSSCPPAQEWINGLVQSPRLWTQVIPVVFHVDYWDYLGWRDPFAAVKYTQRQRNYNAGGGIRSVYTPAFVLNGREWRGWFQSQPLPEPQQSLPAGILTVHVQRRHLSAGYSTANGELLLQAAVLGFGITTPVSAGENKNRVLEEEFCVLFFEQVSSADGTWQLELPATLSSDIPRFGVAVWVCRPDDATPLQATGGWLDRW